jgi:predicted nucleic acid-binding protein
LRLVFVDTSAWIALGSQDDQYHQPAVDFFKILDSERARLVTSDFVLCETYTGLSGTVRPQVIESFRNWVFSSMDKGRLILERVGPGIFDAAWDILMRYYEHGPSYTDCTSIVIAESISADCAFAFDNHFPIMGVDAQPFVPARKRTKKGKAPDA